MTHAIEVESIYRYPVKGLSVERLTSVDVREGMGIPLDRAFAIAHGSSTFDVRNPAWVSRRNFVVVAHSPGITLLRASLSEDLNTLTLGLADRELVRIDTSDDACEALDYVLSKLGGAVQPGPYRLVSGGDTVPSLTDSPVPAVSLMSVSSLKDLSGSTGTSLVRERFRGNIWITAAEPWEELSWVGGELSIGEVGLKVMEPIVRCAAVDVEPDCGIRRPEVLRSLSQGYGHAHFGVLARVVRGGRISTGSTLVVSKTPGACV